MLKIYINASFPKLIQNLSLYKYLNYHLLHSFDLTFFFSRRTQLFEVRKSNKIMINDSFYIFWIMYYIINIFTIGYFIRF